MLLLEAHALPRASSPRQRPRNPRQRLCRGLPSAKTPQGIFRRRRGLCRGPFIGHSAKKRGRQAPAPLAVSLPRAHPRQRNGFFLNLFAKGRPSANNFFLFFLKTFAEGLLPGPRQRNFQDFLKILCRGPALGKEMVFLNFSNPLPRACSLALGKEIFSFFPKKIFAEGYC